MNEINSVENIENKFIETKESFGDFTKICIENVKTGMKLEIIPEKGAKINSLSFNNGNEVVNVIDGYESPEDVEENVYSKSSMLAPFPNRVADGAYEFEGDEYSLPINMPQENNSIHGFVENEIFQVVESSQSQEGYEIRLRLESGGTNEGYPFPFTMDIVYRLTDSGLETEISAENTGTKNMPFGHGWHPYFKTKGSVQVQELQLPKVEQIEVDDRLIPTGKKIPFDDFSNLKKLEEAEFDTGFRLLDGEGRVLLVDHENNIQIAVIMEGENNKYQYVQIFTPPAGCPAENSIAVEPMTCEANAFNSGNGLLVLMPNEKFVGSYRVDLSSVE